MEGQLCPTEGNGISTWDGIGEIKALIGWIRQVYSALWRT